jgi:large subunit ribosomal protein L18e
MAVVKKTMTTNKVLFDTIRDLKKLSNKTDVGLYKAVARILSKTGSQRPKVNVLKINKFANVKEAIIVPGKVLGSGNITKPVEVIGLCASCMAVEKIKKAGGKFTLISDFIKTTPKIKPRIIG